MPTRSAALKLLSVCFLSLAAACDCKGTPTKETEVVIAIYPQTATVGMGEVQQFDATVLGTDDLTVSWSVEEGEGGVVNAQGRYLAPNVTGTFHVRVTSNADAMKSASATVTVVKAAPKVVVSVSPGAVSLVAGQTQQFIAAVAGGESTDVTWSLQESGAAGTVTAAGLYTAPATPGTYHVVATSVADTTAHAAATITVTAAPVITLSVNPSQLSLGAGQTQQFNATVMGSTDTAVTWSVQEAMGGTLSSGGFYTAPVTPGVYHVEAKAHADPSKTAVATVTVLPVTVVVTPATALVEIGATQQFTAMVGNASNTTVTWSLMEGTVCGTVSSTGLYNPPSTPRTCHVVATAAANGTTTASATVEVINPVVVRITPMTVTLSMNQTQQFTATVMGSTNQAVTWSVREGATGGTITAAGLYTAPTVAAQGVFHVVATPQANPAKSAEATVTVNPGIGVQVTPQLVSLTPSSTQTFAATVTGTANTAVTWAVQEGAGGGTITAAGKYTAPASSGTYHVVATSAADTTKKGFATVIVLGAPVNVTGIVTYSGTKTGTVYVLLAYDDGSPGIVGTSTTLSGGQAPFTLRGIRQRGSFTVRAFIDTLSSGMYHQAVDPFGTVDVTVGNSGLTGVVVPATDSTWNKWTSLATPSIGFVAPGDESVAVGYFPAWDSNGNDECKDYRIYWSDQPMVSGTNNIGSMLITANSPRVAVVRGLTNGQRLYFTMTCPDALLLGGYAAEVGPITVGVPAGGNTLSGVVNAPALPGSIVPPLYVLALSETGTRGYLARVASPTTSQAWSMPGVQNDRYQVFAFRDVGGDGKLTPTDPATFFDPVRVTVSGGAQSAPTIDLSAANGVATVSTGHLNDTGTHSYSLFFRMRANLKRPVKAALIAGPKIAVPYDLPLNETGGARHEVNISLASIAPAAGDTYSIQVTYSDGTSETLMAAVNALLPTPEVVSPTSPAPTTPSFDWNPLSPNPPFAYTTSLEVYDWSYLALGNLAPLLGYADDLDSSVTFLLYSDVHPTKASLQSSLLPYWLQLTSEDQKHNWSRTVTTFTVQ